MKKLIKKIIIFFVPIELLEHAIFEFRAKLGRLLSSNIILNRFKNSKLKLKHYNTEWHNTAFALPEYIARLILD